MNPFECKNPAKRYTLRMGGQRIPIARIGSGFPHENRRESDNPEMARPRIERGSRNADETFAVRFDRESPTLPLLPCVPISQRPELHRVTQSFEGLCVIFVGVAVFSGCPRRHLRTTRSTPCHFDPDSVCDVRPSLAKGPQHRGVSHDRRGLNTLTINPRPANYRFVVLYI